MKIWNDLIELRKKVGGLKSQQRNGVMFPVKSAKDLMDKIRKGADELNMPMAGATISSNTFDVPGFQVYNKGAGQMVPQLVCHTTVTVRFMSDDGSFVDFSGSGHGSSNDDKAGGKASTYAWKDAVVKGLSLPDSEMVDTDDESVPLAKSSPAVKKSWPKRN